MSYQINMLFKQCNNRANAYEQARRFTKQIYNNITDMFEMIGHTNIPSEMPGFQDIPESLREHINDYWLYALCNIHFAYFDEQRLLGIVGNYPESISNFADAEIYFQNRTDQDYDYETWDNIDYFRFWSNFVKYMPEDKFLKEYYTENERQAIINGEKDIDFDYEKKSKIYNIIVSRLGLEPFIGFREKHPNVTSFTMNAINCYSDEYHLGMILKRWLKPIRLKIKGIRYLREIAEEKLGDKFDPVSPLWSITILEEADGIHGTFIKLEIFEDENHDIVKETTVIDTNDIIIDENGCLTLKKSERTENNENS